MLSILIPTRDYTCYKLVEDLQRQAELLGVPYEILLAEDGSKDRVSIIANHKITDLPHCQHIVRPTNIGLASTRNELADLAQYPWLIYIDNDARVERDDYLSTYLRYAGQADVVVGGLRTPDVCYDPHRTLRHRYELAADQHRSAADRAKQPYSQMSCFNVMMRRETFLQIRFDEACREYGYEDALFGVELEQRGVGILHIDNPLLHTGMDLNEDFLRKSETALRTLHGLNGKMRGRSAVENASKRLRSAHVAWLYRLFYRATRGLMRRNLLGRHPSLTVFSLYKLGYFLDIRPQKTKKAGSHDSASLR
ncbi:MAG: glycosyltransferase [Bacteroidaceae bacterium]|nr:glycosyltransferase [Bacteroidaceae bacterium]